MHLRVAFMFSKKGNKRVPKLVQSTLKKNSHSKEVRQPNRRICGVRIEGNQSSTASATNRQSPVLLSSNEKTQVKSSQIAAYQRRSAICKNQQLHAYTFVSAIRFIGFARYPIVVPSCSSIFKLTWCDSLHFENWTIHVDWLTHYMTTLKSCPSATIRRQMAAGGQLDKTTVLSKGAYDLTHLICINYSLSISTIQGKVYHCSNPRNQEKLDLGLLQLRREQYLLTICALY